MSWTPLPEWGRDRGECELDVGSVKVTMVRRLLVLLGGEVNKDAVKIKKCDGFNLTLGLLTGAKKRILLTFLNGKEGFLLKL